MANKEFILQLKKHPQVIKDLLIDSNLQIQKLSREDTIKLLIKKIKIWELLTTRNEDFPYENKEWLKTQSTSELKHRLKWYMSEESYISSFPWLIDVIYHMSKKLK